MRLFFLFLCYALVILFVIVFCVQIMSDRLPAAEPAAAEPKPPSRQAVAQSVQHLQAKWGEHGCSPFFKRDGTERDRRVADTLLNEHNYFYQEVNVATRAEAEFNAKIVQGIKAHMDNLVAEIKKEDDKETKEGIKDTLRILQTAIIASRTCMLCRVCSITREMIHVVLAHEHLFVNTYNSFLFAWPQRLVP